MTVSCAQIIEKFSNLVSLAKGSATATAQAPCSSQSPREGGLCFCPTEEALKRAIESPVSIIITTPELANKDINPRAHQALMTAKALQLAMAVINSTFFPVEDNRRPFAGHRIHPTAVIDPSARISETAIIGPHVVIGENVQIDSDVVIGANTTIESHCLVGEKTHIHAQVYIGHHVEIGRHCIIKPQSALGTDGYGYAQDEKGQHFKKPHYGKVIIEDDVHIGSGVMVDRGTFEDAVIGEGTKIDNCCHFGHNVRIGKNCLITAGMITAGSATIGDHCVFGGRTTIGGHIRIVDQVHIAALSSVPNNVKKPGKYGGYPLMPLSTSLKAHASFVHLGEMRKNLRRVMKHLGLSAEKETKE